MHQRRKCHRHLWLLSGTGEGPRLAEDLIKRGWNISVSVVSRQASFAYRDLPLAKLTIGSISGSEGIKKILIEAQIAHKGFDLIIDATHPFAALISSNLREACKELDQPLLRYERPIEELGNAKLIHTPKDFSGFDLRGQRLLMAIGSRSLKEASMAAKEGGAIVFARILPMQESLLKALNSSLPETHLATLRPIISECSGDIELALCRKWSITGIVCRQSGGATEKLWQNISKLMKLDLWLISRPMPPVGMETVNTFEELLNYLAIIYV
tara:strand:- start:2820 stop:3629 length:810 start_codon:yes stop_codon:yes gene_type:complete